MTDEKTVKRFVSLKTGSSTMGSTRSRPRPRKVAPCNSLQEEAAQPKPQWTLPALPVTVEQQTGSMGQKKTALPPLKQEITLSTLSDNSVRMCVLKEPCFTGNFASKQCNNSSIIHSHPPQRPQALQPVVLQIGHTSTVNQIAMGKNCRDGGVHQFSTTGQTGHSGTCRMTQGRFLEAQTALTQQAHQHRRAHLRQAREQRRHKVVYTVNVGGPNTEGIQRLKLVRRPTERDIFWDDTTGERLDPSCLLDPKSLPRLCEERQSNQPVTQLPSRGGERIQGVQARGQTQQTGHWGLSLNKNLWGTEREILSIEDRGKTQRDSWMSPESARSCQTARVRGAMGILDYKLDK